MHSKAPQTCTENNWRNSMLNKNSQHTESFIYGVRDSPLLLSMSYSMPFCNTPPKEFSVTYKKFAEDVKHSNLNVKMLLKQ